MIMRAVVVRLLKPCDRKRFVLRLIRAGAPVLMLVTLPLFGGSVDAITSTVSVDKRTGRLVRRMVIPERIIQARIGEFPLETLAALLDRHRIAYGRISTIADLVAHRSATRTTVETPAGKVEMLAPPVIVDGERARLGRVPALGEHTEALRREFKPAVPKSQTSAAR